MYSPKFAISNKILKNISAAEASKEVIENAPLVPSFEKQFQSDALVRTVYHGTHIEGNDLTMIQTKKVLEGEEVYARDRDIQEVINYRNVVNLLGQLSEREKYDTAELNLIHQSTVDKLIDPSKVGHLRNTQVVIKEEGTGKIIFSPPNFIEVPYLLEDFFEWLNSADAKDIHPIIRAGITHYVLVSIHPYVEGNGRTVRAFTTLVMLKEGYDIRRFFALEEHFDNDLGAYYEALGKVDSANENLGLRDLTPWLEYFTLVVASELAKIKERVRKLSVDTRLKTKIGNQVALSERQMKLVEFLSDEESAGMKELKSVLNFVSEDTVLRDLTDLIKKGIIKKEGQTKSARYVIINANK
ncbi:MAG TPA: Fic family protein [Patescibacteria group bacterium]|nr:Fic family protein [Patescibacteria group bacterium]